MFLFMKMDKKLKVTVVTVLVSVVVCLVAVLVLVLTMPDRSRTQQQICLPNKDGHLNCGLTADLFHEYLENTVEKTYDNIEAQEQSRLREMCKQALSGCRKLKPVAKLTGIKQSGTLNTNDLDADMVTITEWRHGKELYGTCGFERHGIRYRNGRLIVPIDGSYFVHSFVDLFEPCDPSTGKPDVKDPTKPIKHGIFRFNILDRQEIELVSNVQPRAVSCSKRFNSYNSYVSSLADLKAEDELFVKVSNISFLKYTRDNYFGIHLI